MAVTASVIFTNGNKDSTAVTITPAVSPGLLKGTLYIDGNHGSEGVGTLVMSATVGAVANNGKRQFGPGTERAINIEIYCTSLQFSIVGGSTDTALNVKLVWE